MEAWDVPKTRFDGQNYSIVPTLSQHLGISEKNPCFSIFPFYPNGLLHHFPCQSGPRIETFPQIVGDPQSLGAGVRVAGLSQGLRQELICVREVRGPKLNEIS